MSRLPVCERGRLTRDAFAVGTRFQHSRATICCSAADDDGHAPALDERAPLDTPAPREITQHAAGQRIEPSVDRDAEPTSEAPAQFVVKLRDARWGHA